MIQYEIKIFRLQFARNDALTLVEIYQVHIFIA